MKTRLYSDESEATVTMISGTCLVCDYQGVPHRIFCDVTASRRQPGRPEIEQLRYRLEGVLAVTLTLGPGLPNGLCLKCEKGLCEIESRVRGLRDMHHTTREKYRQMRGTGDAFICDLTRLETRHSESGSDTSRETETRSKTETYLQQSSLLQTAPSHVTPGIDLRRVRGQWEVCREREVTPPPVTDVAGVQSTGFTIRPGAMHPERRHSIGGAQLTDNTMDINRKVAQPTHSTISSYANSTTKAYGNMATNRRNSISHTEDGRTQVSSNINIDDGHCNDRHMNGENCSGIGGQLNVGMEHASSRLVDNRNIGQFKDITDDAFCRRLDTECSVNSGNSAPERQNGIHQELYRANECVNGHSTEEPYFAQGNECYTNTSVNNCPCPVYQEQNQTVNNGAETGLENQPCALNLSQTVVLERPDDTNGLVLDLTVPHSVQKRQHIERQIWSIDDAINNATNEALMRIEASKSVQAQKDYPIGNSQNEQWNNSYDREKQGVNNTPKATWACSKGPPPLIHVSQIKNEPIENERPFNGRDMSSLDFLQKTPICIAPIEDDKGVGKGQFYDESFLGEPPQKRYKYGRGYSVPNQDKSTSSFPVLNTHVSATLNVTHPENDIDKNMTSEKAPNSDTVRTTTIQGTIRIPLNQLQNMKNGPANISLMTEATVNSTVVSDCQQESSHEQSQHPQHKSRIPVNMRINADELHAGVPIQEVFLDHVHSAIPRQGVHQPSQRVLDAFETHGIPVHHLNTSSHLTNPDSVNMGHPRNGLQPPEWMRIQRLVQGVQIGNYQSDANLHLPQPGQEVTGYKGHGHSMQGQGHNASDKLVSNHQMASYGWQHPRFSSAVVSYRQPQGQSQPMFPVPLQYPNMSTDKRSPQGHISQPYQGQTESQFHEGQTLGQGQKERTSAEHQDQEQPNQGHIDKGNTEQRPGSQGQCERQVKDREPGHCLSLPVGDQPVQNTTVQKNNQLDSSQNKSESEDEEDEEDEGKHVTDQDVNPGNLPSRNETSGRRQLLRPWLEERLDSGHIPGFQWVEKDRNLFKIPWKHRSKNDWSPDNCAIFMEWALHTGKHRAGMDKPDYCRWKTRLRCAFNQAPDIQERKEFNKMKCSEPYKVYEFLSKSDIKPKLPPKAKPKIDLSWLLVPSNSTTVPSDAPGTVPDAASSNYIPTCSTPQHVATVQSPRSNEIYTAVTGALLSVGDPSIRYSQGSPSPSPSSSASDQQDDQPLAASTEQKSTDTTKMAAGVFQAEPVSIPVETNNNKFSWDADLDDEGPLVIDLDWADKDEDMENREDVHKGKNEPSCAHDRQNRQTQGLYTCDLCRQSFTLEDALVEHKNKIHGIFSDKSEMVCNGIVNVRPGSFEGNRRNISRTSSYGSHSQSSDSN